MCSRPLFSLYFGDGVWVGSSEQLLLLLGYITPPFAFWFAQRHLLSFEYPHIYDTCLAHGLAPQALLAHTFLGHLGHVDILAS